MSNEELYRDLQRHLDRTSVGFPATDSGVEIRILEKLFTPEDARLALCLSALPEPLSAIHKRVRKDMSAGALEAALDGMASRGLIQRFEKSRKVLYAKSVFVLGIYEAQVNRLSPELERDALQYLDEAFWKNVVTTKNPQLRTVPVNRTIPLERGVAQYDDIRRLVSSSPGPFAVLNCICRQGKDLLHEPCRRTKGRENCLVFGGLAKAIADSQVGRLISREAMMEMLDRADQEGLVLQPQNTQDPWFVCCCCGCCCGMLAMMKKLPRPAEYFGTSYYAELDSGACQGCGVCADRCQMEALSSNNGTTRLDATRCIGCGLCVTTCPSGALRLRRKDPARTPPKDVETLYKQMFVERYGPLGTLTAMGRKILGLKV